MAKKQSQLPHSEYEQLAFHPYNVILVLLMSAMGMLFLGVVGAWIYNRFNAELPAVRIPWLFYPNTLLLLGASWSMERVQRAYERDEVQVLLKYLVYTLVLSVLFLLSQLVAWYVLFLQNLGPSANNSMGYLYALSGLHFLHVVLGLPFLGVFWYQTHKRLAHEAGPLIFFSDAEQRLRLRLLRMYWHFIDGLWVFLLLVLMINAIIG